MELEDQDGEDEEGEMCVLENTYWGEQWEIKYIIQLCSCQIY